MSQNFIKTMCAGALTVLLLNTAVAQTPYPIYNNSGSYNGTAFNSVVSGQQIGNEISLDGQTWALTQFQIQYDIVGSVSPNIALQVSLYQNDGPLSSGYHSPGTLIWSSGTPYGLNTTLGLYGLSYDQGVDWTSPIYLAGNFTFIETYTGTDLSGLEIPLCNNPSGQPGTSYGDYWFNSGSGWSLNVATPPGNANLVVNLEGTPEPSVMALSTLGGVLLLGVNQLRRKRA